MTAATRAVHRYEIPVDDAWHPIKLTGPVLHVDCRQSDVVDIWVGHRPDADPEVREFRVFGTGHPLPEDAALYVGTALSPAMEPFARRGALVWHVFDRGRGDAPSPGLPTGPVDDL